ncbi:winged helix-turn-helix transcriptional regulator [Vibrio quintilis]|uniref:Putative HTH-type transcriptional regulator YybR n=1 Tax=Vibrio quintilis TaxID=1117707 RepID=A0A1M7YY80_9VIBR|nr:helix-turn-helix domain-containing protein [Vibrio quintilis]SHO57637.1 putative HTH-type transcriptional regulator YybR [Vibrio quintilis]
MEINKKTETKNQIHMLMEMGGANVLAPECPSREVLRHISGRWGALVFWALRDGEKHRFSDIRRTIRGISEKMLSQTLQHLEYDGFVERTVHPVVPPHVEYHLTPLGAEFGSRVADLITWLEGNFIQILEARGKAEDAPDRKNVAK